MVCGLDEQPRVMSQALDLRVRVRREPIEERLERSRGVLDERQRLVVELVSMLRCRRERVLVYPRERRDRIPGLQGRRDGLAVVPDRDASAVQHPPEFGRPEIRVFRDDGTPLRRTHLGLGLPLPIVAKRPRHMWRILRERLDKRKHRVYEKGRGYQHRSRSRPRSGVHSVSFRGRAEFSSAAASPGLGGSTDELDPRPTGVLRVARRVASRTSPAELDLRRTRVNRGETAVRGSERRRTSGRRDRILRRGRNPGDVCLRSVPTCTPRCTTSFDPEPVPAAFWFLRSSRG